MSKDVDSNEADRIIDEYVKKQLELDSICKEINFTLLAYRKLRFNELLRTLKKFDVKITQPTLKEHLNHLIDKGLVERKEEGFQNVSYSLIKEIDTLMHVPPEEVKKWFEAELLREDIPEELREKKISRKEIFKHYNTEQLDKKVIADLSNVLSLNLYELKSYIEYDLKIDEFQNDSDFWNFAGDLLYRHQEKSIAEDCRASDEYKKLLFEKIELLAEELRSDKELLRKRRETGKRVRL